MGYETVAEPGCSRSEAAEPPPRGEQGKLSMVWMCGVFDDVVGSAETALVCIILDGWKRSPDDLLCHPHHPLQQLPVQGSGVAKPDGDAVGQHALCGASIGGGQDGM